MPRTDPSADRASASSTLHRPRAPRWLGLLATIAGSVLGLATNLYSAGFRHALSTSSRWLSPAVLSVVLAAAVGSASALLIYRYVTGRRTIPETTVGEIKIGADALKNIDGEENSIVGRSLRYLEVARESPELLVFLHGLGLDASDFQSYMAESRFHCVAFTMYGFNADERDDAGYRPLSLDAHIRLLGYALKALRRRYPNKRLTIVGFSFGADVLLLLNKMADDVLGSVKVKRVILLDPNINHSTTTISAKIADIGVDGALTQLVGILHSARDFNEFGYLCAYLNKITSKNFAQVHRFASEVVKCWNGDGYDTFLDRLGQLSHVVHEVHIILSFGVENQFNGMVRAAQNRGLDVSNLDCSRSGHFDLIQPWFLKARLEGLLRES